MTEKEYFIPVFDDNGKKMGDVVDILNKYVEENKQLKKLLKKQQSEKRFIEQNPENHLNKIYDTQSGKVIFDEDIVDVLNALNDENEQLKKDIEALNYELTEIKQSEEDNYNITDGLW